MGTKLHVIPGTTINGKTRGGGSERIDWVTNGPMRLVRNVTFHQPAHSVRKGEESLYAYLPTPSYDPGSPDDDNTVRSKGDAAIAMARPSAPSVNLLTSAGELAMDGLPTLPDVLRWRRSVADLLQLGQDASRDYVAYNFAWKPLEREIRTYYRNVARSSEIVKQAQHPSNNRVVHVGHEYPATNTTSASIGNVIGANWNTSATLGTLSQGVTRKTVLSRVWYEGKYLNFTPIPKDAAESARGFAAQAKTALGIKLTPEVLWNLAPWSWFADWLSNTDTIMGAVSGALADGMVPVEGWVMHHHQRRSEVTNAPNSRWTSGTCVNLSETKLRFISAPYIGFGGVGTLTGRQISILAALGISRG